MNKLIFATVLVATHFLISASAQDPEPKRVARQLDVMTTPNCERLQAALDMAGAEMQNNPQDMLYAIVHPAVGGSERVEGSARQINAWLVTRRFDASRITIAIGGERENLQVELIGIPPGADAPATERVWERKSRFADAKPGKAATLITEDVEDPNPCFDEGSAMPDLADFLAAHPEARMRIVVKISSVKDFNDAAKEMRRELAERSASFPARVRIVHVRTAKWPKDFSKQVEYWLLPAPRK